MSAYQQPVARGLRLRLHIDSWELSRLPWEVLYDSRRGEDEFASFERGYDPLDETLYPTTGDRSQRSVLSSSSEAFSACASSMLAIARLPRAARIWSS